MAQRGAFTYSPLQMYDKRTISKHFPPDEGLPPKTSALKLFTVANLCYQLNRWYQIALLYSSIDAAPQFL